METEKLFELFFQKCKNLKRNEFINIATLINEANYHRQTFYKKYHTKENFYESALYSKFNIKLNEIHTVKEYLVMFYRLTTSEKEILKNLSNNYYFSYILRKMFQKNFKDILQKENISLNYSNYVFISGGVISCLYSFLNGHITKDEYSIFIFKDFLKCLHIIGKK